MIYDCFVFEEDFTLSMKLLLDLYQQCQKGVNNPLSPYVNGSVILTKAIRHVFTFSQFLTLVKTTPSESDFKAVVYDMISILDWEPKEKNFISVCCVGNPYFNAAQPFGVENAILCDNSLEIDAELILSTQLHRRIPALRYHLAKNEKMDAYFKIVRKDFCRIQNLPDKESFCVAGIFVRYLLGLVKIRSSFSNVELTQHFCECVFRQRKDEWSDITIATDLCRLLLTCESKFEINRKIISMFLISYMSPSVIPILKMLSDVSCNHLFMCYRLLLESDNEHWIDVETLVYYAEHLHDDYIVYLLIPLAKDVRHVDLLLSTKLLTLEEGFLVPNVDHLDKIVLHGDDSGFVLAQLTKCFDSMSQSSIEFIRTHSKVPSLRRSALLKLNKLLL
jgi:hypothetical protein